MEEMREQVPAALYARVSSDRQDVDLSVSAQLRALRDYAAKNGYVVKGEYIDEAESGLIIHRPQFPGDAPRGQEAERAVSGDPGGGSSPGSRETGSTRWRSRRCCEGRV